ncbi:MEKHLA domain-containing protein [Paraburkholderia kururiensis]|uniref:MEKHLA domain-containing protein n=1 Tax=Paraburkholderia kururiensis TaxID=984307 RepID=A0ABZ0WNX4_9BURK|nr:MEKHLA domain-containing protein [Paraburkholderia kururiensis]WQD79094.1 MEKHLA domain-containing protein [Paraburkholderia kururiensis]
MSLSTDADFFRLLADSYRRLLNRSLVPDGMSAAEGAAWLYGEAPFGILAHNTAPDPVFVYGNRRAQAIFGYDWDELTALPSRLSAEPVERSERQAFLDQVTRDGFVSGYRGVRITKSGVRFWIEQATVWQLTDAAGNYRGQAAMIPDVRLMDGGA